jgi:hypothetical protein
VVFTPSSSAAVKINSFNFHGYYNSDERFTFNWEVLSGATSLTNGIISFRSDGTKNHSVSVNYTGSPNEELVLRLTRADSTPFLEGAEFDGDKGNIAVDDISFAQIAGGPIAPVVGSQAFQDYVLRDAPLAYYRLREADVATNSGSLGSAGNGVNIVGGVRVTGHDADRVEMRATETVRGDLQADIERARAELGLRTESEPGRVAFRVRPLNGDSDCNCRGRGWDSYSVEYDIEVRVPRGAALEVGTVNDGDVTVEDVDGEFELRNVNGAVRLVRAGGSGTVQTVNGNVDATFARAPQASTSFRTVNGELDVTFPEDLSAELAFRTMQGDVFTDFEVVSLSDPPAVQRDRGRFRMSTNRSSAFRVGAGGERHSFNTLNGDIFVRKAD